jgi:carbon storage regulator
LDPIVELLTDRHFTKGVRTMLVLSRKVNEEVVIGNDIHIKVIRVDGSRIRLGISAPHEMSIRRREIDFELGGTETEAGSWQPDELMPLS